MSAIERPYESESTGIPPLDLPGSVAWFGSGALQIGVAIHALFGVTGFLVLAFGLA